MEIIRHIDQMQEWSTRQREQGKTIAFVPTLGALHEGHMSLLRKAHKKSDRLVMSIFLNPIQFSDLSDLRTYPKTMRKDLHLVQAHHVDVVFCPSVKEMYPKDFSTYVIEERLSKGLCGKDRPGHFKGVATVVAKLFNIVQPHIAFFGQKDAQQSRVIQRMVRDLGWNIEIQVPEIVRDIDGLALSSRNVRLSSKERQDSLSLNEALFMAKVMISGGERQPKKVIQKIKKLIQSRPSAKIDYIEIVNTQTLESIKTLKGEVLIMLAVRFGKVRLIDNLNIKV